MKKNKSKSKNQSASKKIKKELEAKLVAAFTTVADQFGKTKKASSTIEKFAKQLIKKIEYTPQKEVIDLEETPAAAPVKAKAKTAVEKETKPAAKKVKVAEEVK